MDRFIKLSTESKLDLPIVRSWFNSVVDQGPSGVVTPVTVEDDDDERHVVRLVHQTCADGRHAYVIPLARDLQPTEIDRVVEQFADKHPDLDFDVETNQTRLKARDYESVPIDAAKHLALCTAMAKQKHEDWVRERTSSGWRYGLTFDQDEKTHPLIRPWDQLPEHYKQPDMAWPQQLIGMLNNNGYVVIPRSDLDRLTAKKNVLRPR
jgi:hypothetical protein